MLRCAAMMYSLKVTQYLSAAYGIIVKRIRYTGQVQKIILYYKFAPLLDPVAVKLWQKALGERLNLRGRILLSTHGINGTLGGDIDDLKAYIKELKTFPAFHATEFKWGDGGRDNFPKFSVKVRDEIVSFGVANELQVDQHGVVGSGKHLKPVELHQLVSERGDEVVFFDGRNAYEAKVGKFKNAIISEARTSKDFLDELGSDKYNEIKNKPVVTYCTGGIRCEILSSLMKNRGFKEVYQLDGGIVTYGQTYGDDGLWEGSLYVFDGRMGLKFSDRAKDIGVCVHCGGATSRYTNCVVKTCNDLIVVCNNCAMYDRCSACEQARTTIINHLNFGL